MVKYHDMSSEIDDDTLALLGKSYVARTVTQLGAGVDIEGVSTRTIKLLEDESKDVLLAHLKAQMGAVSVRRGGSGSVNKVILFCKNELNDRFGMDDSAIAEALKNLD